MRLDVDWNNKVIRLPYLVNLNELYKKLKKIVDDGDETGWSIGPNNSEITTIGIEDMYFRPGSTDKECQSTNCVNKHAI